MFASRLMVVCHFDECNMNDFNLQSGCQLNFNIVEEEIEH
jgi:hypothetical protein